MIIDFFKRLSRGIALLITGVLSALIMKEASILLCGILGVIIVVCAAFGWEKD